MPPVRVIERLCHSAARRLPAGRLLTLLAVIASTLPGLLAVVPARAGHSVVTVAVASNFRHTAGRLAEAFEAAYGHPVVLSSASTGALYAQVVNGAPFDVLLAADTARPQRLEREGLAVAGSRFTYARGALVLWSAVPAATDSDCLAAMAQTDGGHIAIANPMTAPYGAAARQTLEQLGLWATLAPRLVMGENVAQTMAFAATGNATFALFAAAQLELGVLPETGCSWAVPADYHAPIDQQAVLLRRGQDRPGAAAFLDYVRSNDGRRIITGAGYRLP